jgi:NADH dehydrogenase FAD-containing subunit
MLKRFIPKALSTSVSRAFSSAIHTPICVIGGGTAGVSFTSQILREDSTLHNNIRIFDPATYHYYQPGWTFVGAGMAKIEEMVTTMDKMIPKGVEWTRLGVQKIDAENNTLITADGQKYTYDELVIASGIINKYEQVKGT